MAKKCSKGDGYPVWSKGLCQSHWKQEYGKPIPKMSGKLQAAQPTYKANKAMWSPLHRKCEARLSGCTVIANKSPHHMEGRDTVELLLDMSKWLAVCESCHGWITDHSKEAIAMGLSLRRNTPV